LELLTFLELLTLDLLFAGAAAASTAAGIGLGYRNWRQRHRALLRSNSRIIHTSRGPVEYAVRGEGPAVLVIHGCPGGYDQGLIAADLAGAEGFQFIAVSRPGYLRTPLRLGRSPEEQANCYAALLDALGIRQAAIIGISGGGPSALQFALRHPERCWALVTVCAISRCLTETEIENCKSPLRHILFTTDLVSRLALSTLYFRPLLRNGAGARAGSAGWVEARMIAGLLRSMTFFSKRRVGLLNDERHLTSMPTYPLQEIKVPTLVLHGTADEIVPFSHAEHLAEKVPRAQLMRVKGGKHIFFATHREAVLGPLFDFFKAQHCAGSPEPAWGQAGGASISRKPS
jgi:pimeloyl-ACP methyl ester carboxylesterase